MMNRTGGNLSVMDDFVDIRDAIIRDGAKEYGEIVEEWNEKFGDQVRIEIDGEYHEVVSELKPTDFDL